MQTIYDSLSSRSLEYGGEEGASTLLPLKKGAMGKSADRKYYKLNSHSTKIHIHKPH